MHGPNLDRLGRREVVLYGRRTLAELDASLIEFGRALDVDVTCRQSNLEGELVTWIGGAADAGFGAIVLNAAGYTHTSVAVRDAVAAAPLPTIEVHLTQPQAREPFRHVSLLAPVAAGSIAGFGELGYRLGLRAAVECLQHRRPARGKRR